jgi:hypothetical protein
MPEAMAVLECILERSLITTSSLSAVSKSRQDFPASITSPNISFAALPLAILYAVEKSYEVTIINYDPLTKKIFSGRKGSAVSLQNDDNNGASYLFNHNH